MISFLDPCRVISTSGSEAIALDKWNNSGSSDDATATNLVVKEVRSAIGKLDASG